MKKVIKKAILLILLVILMILMILYYCLNKFPLRADAINREIFFKLNVLNDTDTVCM